jgi:hypothetical protein
MASSRTSRNTNRNDKVMEIIATLSSDTWANSVEKKIKYKIRKPHQFSLKYL